MMDGGGGGGVGSSEGEGAGSMAEQTGRLQTRQREGHLYWTSLLLLLLLLVPTVSLSAVSFRTNTCVGGGVLGRKEEGHAAHELTSLRSLTKELKISHCFFQLVWDHRIIGEAFRLCCREKERESHPGRGRVRLRQQRFTRANDAGVLCLLQALQCIGSTLAAHTLAGTFGNIGHPYPSHKGPEQGPKCGHPTEWSGPSTTPVLECTRGGVACR
jgi:hypothetical protein